MGKRIYLVRHCRANGQDFAAELTCEGIAQTKMLVNFFSNILIDRIITSPYTRAVDSISPLATEKDIQIEIDKRLSERVLSTENLIDWQEKLRLSFNDIDISFQGGESSREAMYRGLGVIHDLREENCDNIVISTHGNLMALILKAYLPSFGYADWKRLTNPDVYLIELENATIQRLWK